MAASASHGLYDDMMIQHQVNDINASPGIVRGLRGQGDDLAQDQDADAVTHSLATDSLLRLYSTPDCLNHHSCGDVMIAVTELTNDIQFTIDRNGKIKAVVLSPELWLRLAQALEDAEDRELVKMISHRLAQGPQAAGALRWEDIANEWA